MSYFLDAAAPDLNLAVGGAILAFWLPYAGFFAWSQRAWTLSAALKITCFGVLFPTVCIAMTAGPVQAFWPALNFWATVGVLGALSGTHFE